MRPLRAPLTPETLPLIAGLSGFLADTYTLYLTTQGFHWNVTGPHFPSLHALFEGQYMDLRGAVDQLAERIRTLGHPAPASFHRFQALGTLPEAPDTVPDAMEMVRLLLVGHETLAHQARTLISTASAAEDVGTADLLTERLRVHEKTAWMLRAMLG